MSRSGQRRGATSTSNFGVGRRESHDSSAFYRRFPLPEITDASEIAPHACVDQLWEGDARDMDRYGDIADSSVALVVTSPPYYTGKEYEESVGEGHIPASYIDYLEMLHEVFEQCREKLEPGGRIAVNVANLGRRPYRSLSADVIDILQNRLKLLLRGEVIWQKARGATGSCAWGTFQQPGNPVLRDLTERVVIASKGRFDRARRAEDRAVEGLPSNSSAFADEYMEATTDVWEIRPASATRIGHPAPFPVELPQRLIDLYTYRGDLVLDPFMGAGTTAVAAVRTGRHYVGFEMDAGYVALAERRIAEERKRLASRSGPEIWEVEIPPSSKRNGHSKVPGGRLGDDPAVLPDGGNGDRAGIDSRGDPPNDLHHREGCTADEGECGTGSRAQAGVKVHESIASGTPEDATTVHPGTIGVGIHGNGSTPGDDFQARAVQEGAKAQALAEEILERCGFRSIREKVRCPGGVQVNFEAIDQSGRRWRFDVSGAFTVTQRPGLRRTDTLWKALGKAATLHFAERSEGNSSPPPLVLLTTNRPARNSSGHKALAATTGIGKPIRAVIEMLETEDLSRLADLASGRFEEADTGQRELRSDASGPTGAVARRAGRPESSSAGQRAG